MFAQFDVWSREDMRLVHELVIDDKGEHVIQAIDDEVLLDIFPKIWGWMDGWNRYARLANGTYLGHDFYVKCMRNLEDFRTLLWNHLDNVTRP